MYIHPEQWENLLEKALDAEPFDEEELRDFGAAILADPERGREYAFARVIIEDAGRLPLEAPSPAFADRVMRSIARSPAPVVHTSRVSSSTWNRLAFAVALLFAVAAGWLAGDWNAVRWGGEFFGEISAASTGVLDSALGAIEQWRRGLDGALLTRLLTGMAVALAPMVYVANRRSLRGPEQRL